MQPLWSLAGGLALGLALAAAAPAWCEPKAPAANWKLQFQFPDDPYAVAPTSSAAGWIKFIILTSEPSTVYFQDSVLYPFHYDFATQELAPFLGMTREQFDQVSLYAAGQQAILGAVLIPPLVGWEHVIPEYGIQLVRRDPYARETVRDLFNTVHSAILAAPEVQHYYFPTFEQLETAQTHEAWFAAEGIPVSSAGRWADGNACYSHGWALGDLVYVAGTDIDAAFTAGTLGPEDILLTDAVPSEIPLLAGVLTLSPATPNSHVAILAQTFRVPFAHLALGDDAQRAQDLIGRRIVLRADDRIDHCAVRLIDTSGALTPNQDEQILALKTPPPLNLSAVQSYGSYSAPTDGLQLADIRYFGGKSANFGVLRRSIPAESPVSAAFSFDLWSHFLAQQLSNGRTLREEVDLRLAGYSYPPDIGALSATLQGIRDLFTDTNETVFDAVLQSALLATLQDPRYAFDAYAKLRFRSSTNVEDSDQFTGAGLYDSFSGCLADDLDADELGPSHCDPTKLNERGVFRAIRKVLASFYNRNAYLERLRHGVDESEVGMAILVHHSFPDEIELANGVGTLWRVSGQTRDLYLVTQLGAVSVTNPDPGSVPEEMDIYVSFTGTIYTTLVQASNLVQLGATVMVNPDEYRALTELLLDAALEYELSSGLSDFTLEFEYKKTAPHDDLVVTQVRRIPPADSVPSVTPFLINEPAGYCLFQGEYGEIFGNHRLKSAWQLETRSLWLTAENLQSSFYENASVRYQEGCRTSLQGGSLPLWPLAWHQYDNGVATDGWELATLQNPRSLELAASQVPTLVAPAESPVLVLGDFGYAYDYSDHGCLTLRADYAAEVPAWDWTGPVTTTTDYGLLCRCPEPALGDQSQHREFDFGGVITVSTDFYWPPPVDAAAGYTAPLARFVETTITGLISTPIVLSGEYSQTYRPEHHNLAEHFLFEPGLEPGLPQQQLDELAVLGVRAIHVTDVSPPAAITLYGDATWGDACLDCPGGDADSDGRCSADPRPDCDDSRADLWSAPGEVRDLRFEDGESLQWHAPAETGGNVVRYDLLRGPDPLDFVQFALCVESDDESDLRASDPAVPPIGLFFYLVRGENDCPMGQGPLGTDSNGQARQGRACP